MNIHILNTLFEYRDGKLYNREKRARRTLKGGRAGWLCIGTGYRTIHVDGKTCQEHRAIFLMHHGYLPEFIDHKDRNKLNNRIGNLRPCTKAENQHNRKLNSNSTSGIKGVTWHKHFGMWQARISVNCKRHNLGYYDDIKQAALVVSKARVRLHKQYATEG